MTRKAILTLVFSAFLFQGQTQPAHDSIDLAEAKRRGVSVEVVELERAKARAADAEAKLTKFQQDSAAKTAKLQQDNAALTNKIADLQKKLDADNAQTAKSVVKASNDAVTLKRLGVMGPQMIGKVVTTETLVFVDVREADPDVPDYVVFWARDTKENGLFDNMELLASKKDFGEKIMSLKSGQQIRLHGKIIKVFTEWSLVCDAVEVISPATKPQ